MNKVIIASESHRNRAVAMVQSAPLGFEVTVKERKKDRSTDQNALYWKWLTIIGMELGESKEEIHERMKSDYLVHIYERDDPEYSAMIHAIREVWRSGMKVEAAGLRKQIVKLTSTTTATVKQMTEYMTEVERFAASMAIRLPSPED